MEVIANQPLALTRLKARNYYRKNKAKIKLDRRKRYQHQKHLLKIRKDHSPKLTAETHVPDAKKKGPIKDLYRGKSLKQVGLHHMNSGK